MAIASMVYHWYAIIMLIFLMLAISLHGGSFDWTSDFVNLNFLASHTNGGINKQPPFWTILLDEAYLPPDRGVLVSMAAVSPDMSS